MSLFSSFFLFISYTTATPTSSALGINIFSPKLLLLKMLLLQNFLFLIFFSNFHNLLDFGKKNYLKKKLFHFHRFCLPGCYPGWEIINKIFFTKNKNLKFKIKQKYSRKMQSKFWWKFLFCLDRNIKIFQQKSLFS